jgi:hypothetical protein
MNKVKSRGPTEADRATFLGAVVCNHAIITRQLLQIVWGLKGEVVSLCLWNGEVAVGMDHPPLVFRSFLSPPTPYL